MCIGIQNGGLELELGIRAQVSDAHAIAFSFPHQATALKFLHSSGTRILYLRLAGGCLRRIRNTVAGVAFGAGFGGGVGTGLGFGAGDEEVIRTERDGTGEGEEKGGRERGGA